MDITALDIVRELKDSDYEMFKFVFVRCSKDIYASGRYVDRAMAKLEISEATYWRRLKRLEKLGFIRKYSRGLYEIDNRRFKVMIDKTNQLSAIKW
jgi:predicted transcriptional regulator